jgi:hypothetical protein
MPLPGQITVYVLQRACWHLDGQHDPPRIRRFRCRNERGADVRGAVGHCGLANSVGDAEGEIDANMNVTLVPSENDSVKFPGDFAPAVATGVRHREVTLCGMPATLCVKRGAGRDGGTRSGLLCSSSAFLVLPLAG